MNPALARIRDYLTMRPESERAAKVADADKPALERRRRLVVERRRAAEVLWSGACPASALRLLREAFIEALDLARGTTKVEGLDDVLRALDIRGTDAAPIIDADARLTATPPPALDAEVDAAHVEAFPVVRAALVALERSLAPLVSDAPTLRRARLERQIVAGLVTTLVLASIVFAIRMRFRTWATASASIAPKHDAANVIDFSPEGEWLLPDGTGGWVDVHYSPARTITKVRLLNAHASIYNDRGTRDFTLELYRGDRLLKALDGTLTETPAEPKPTASTWTTWDVGRVTGVDRVRVVVKTWYQKGGGIAEVEVE